MKTRREVKAIPQVKSARDRLARRLRSMKREYGREAAVAWLQTLNYVHNTLVREMTDKFLKGDFK